MILEQIRATIDRPGLDRVTGRRGADERAGERLEAASSAEKARHQEDDGAGGLGRLASVADDAHDVVLVRSRGLVLAAQHDHLATHRHRTLLDDRGGRRRHVGFRTWRRLLAAARGDERGRDQRDTLCKPTKPRATVHHQAAVVFFIVD